MRKLILRSVCLELLGNLAKIVKNEIFDPKISPNNFFWRQKTKRRESSETRFPKVWRLYGPSSRGKLREIFAKVFAEIREPLLFVEKFCWESNN